MTSVLLEPLSPNVRKGEVVHVPTWVATFWISFGETEKAGEFSGSVQRVIWLEDVPDDELCPGTLVTVNIVGTAISIERRSEDARRLS